MAKLIEVQRGQDGAVLATASDAALNDAKPVPVMDVAEVVALEQRIAQEGTSLYTLMTRAGKAVAEAVRQHAPVGSHIVVLVGSGNNDGDGWVAAEDLAEQGYDVALVTKAPAAEIKAEPAKTAALKAEEAALFRIVRCASPMRAGSCLRTKSVAASQNAVIRAQMRSHG